MAVMTVAIDFPNSPSLNQDFAVNGKAWRWNGSKWIAVSGSLSRAVLDDIGDVSASAAINGNFLKYDGQKWVPDSIPTINNLDDVGDVSASAPASGDFLKWNGSSWVNDAINLGTDTTGNYVADVVSGTGVIIAHTPGEASSASISIGQDVSTGASVSFGHVSANITGSLSGNASTATTLQTPRIISLTGDVSGSVSFDGSANASITATVEPNSVALGADTTGNYVADVTAGTGVTVTHTPGEGSSATIAIGQAVGTSASVTFAQISTTGDLTVGGNLTVNGTTTTINTDTLAVEDNIVVLNSNVTGSPTTNAGIEVERGTSANVAIRWNETSDKWEITNDGSNYSDIATESFTTAITYTLDELSNVDASSPSDGEFLKYVSASAAWVPASIPTINSLDDIGDVSASAPSVGDFLKWDGASWVSDTIVGGALISASAPSTPQSGTLWFDSDTAQTYVYYDSSWVEIGGSTAGARMLVSSGSPSSPLEGIIWFDSDTAQTFVYYDGQWIEIGASAMSAAVSTVAPDSPITGQIWFNSETGATYVYYDTVWVEVGAVAQNQILQAINAKGDLIAGTADNTISRLGVGTNGQVLTANSSTATGLEWQTPTTYATTGKAIAMAIVFGG
jgi:hypothetical protein